jgi:ketosteroid isomerase-like protein
MKTRARIVSFLASVVTMAFASSCDAKGPVSKADAAAHAAHENYVTAINSNNLEKLLGMLTGDVVYLAPNSAPMVGKADVKPWLKEYLKAYKTHWDKPVLEFIVSGPWAFERYSYTSTDTPIAGGDVVKDTGWGLVIYHLDADGKWRVARDAWGSDRPVPTPTK